MRKIVRDKFNKLLVIRTDRIGDVVLTLPVAGALHRCYPQAEIVFMVQPYVRDIVKGHKYIARIILDRGERGRQFNGLVRRLRAEKFDAALLLHPTLRLALLMKLAGIPVRIGTAYRLYSFLFSCRVREHRKVSTRHEVEYNLSLVKALGCDDTQVQFDLPVSEAARVDIDTLYRALNLDVNMPLIVIHPGSLASALDWPMSHFTELVGRLAADPVQLLITGSPDEAAITEKLAGAAENARSLAGQLDLLRLSALLERVDLCVANSTGPLHMAAALGTDVVGFYPPVRSMRPRRWGPWGQQGSTLVPEGFCLSCSKNKCERFNCMAEITVESAYQLIQKKISFARTQ